jgi:hypothetical protein
MTTQTERAAWGTALRSQWANAQRPRPSKLSYTTTADANEV